MIIYPYKAGSESAKALAEGLGVKRISHKNSKFKPAPDKVIINWGASKMPEALHECKIINSPEAVATAADKLKFFQAMRPQRLGQVLIEHDDGGKHWLSFGHRYVQGLQVGERCHVDNKFTIKEIFGPEEYPRVPMFTTDIGLAADWIHYENSVVVCRTKLNANSGQGIVVAEEEDQLVEAPLYVRYVPKKQEYRVHVANGQVVDVQRKARRHDVPDDQINWRIRNHDNGFIFARGEALGNVPDDVTTQALRAVKACGLDFGAVDVIFNDKNQEAYVLEINTAPGLSGSTLEGYIQRFHDWEFPQAV